MCIVRALAKLRGSQENSPDRPGSPENCGPAGARVVNIHGLAAGTVAADEL